MFQINNSLQITVKPFASSHAQNWWRGLCTCYTTYRVWYKADLLSLETVTEPAHAAAHLYTYTDMWLYGWGGPGGTLCLTSQFSITMMSLSSSFFNVRVGVCVCACGLRVFFFLFFSFLKNCSQVMKKHTDTQSQQTEPECRDAPCHYSNDKPSGERLLERLWRVKLVGASRWHKKRQVKRKGDRTLALTRYKWIKGGFHSK